MNVLTDFEVDAALLSADQLIGQDRAVEALTIYEGVLEARPKFFLGRLYYGRTLEILQRPREATLNYYRAINDAQQKGRWLSPETTAPALHELVVYAMKFIDTERRRLFEEALAPVRERASLDEFARIDECLAIYLLEQKPAYPDARQRPKFLYVPGIAATAYFARALFPWYADLERETATIRDELLGLLGDGHNFEPFLAFDSPEQVPHFLGGEKPNWNAFFFYRHGRRYDENCARCPVTTAILERLPLVRIPEHAPEICFSVLTPDTHILPHHGSTNARLVTHLPLIVPSDCEIRVGGEPHVWEEGRCITFDDTFEHEAWNRSDKTRAVLIVDGWNPHLTSIEREALTVLIAAIRAFNREAGVTVAE
ncbi:MAG TPA: aspartyl/asparaginyl beta-hydroxylase domain-containing protein [Rudaea sp.]|jgi:aspartate beta-hydroxylase|nr:aspartyl/asparaginyl beta-hydroxylase domain-containing protein [Rudaea sp.]